MILEIIFLWHRKIKFFTNGLTFKSESDVYIVKILKYKTGYWNFFHSLKNISRMSYRGSSAPKNLDIYSFLAAMSSTRSDVVTQSVFSSVCSSVPFFSVVSLKYVLHLDHHRVAMRVDKSQMETMGVCRVF